MIPQYLGPQPEEQQVPLHLFRAYFINTGTFQLLGKRYSVVPIAEEVARLHNWLTKGQESPSERDA